MNEITSDFSEIPKEYPPATGLDSLYVAEIATIGTLVVLDAAIIPGIEPSIETIAIAETLDLTLVDTLLIVRWTDTSLYAPATYQRVASNPGTGAAFQDAVGNWFSNIGPVFTPEMFGALGDGVTDDAAAINIAISAGAGGRGTTVLPGRTTPDFTAPAVYIIRSALLIPSDCYLTIEPGVTIKVGNGANCGGLAIEANASNILIELYGTLDGNAVNQPTTGTPSGGITGNGNVACSDVYVIGAKIGVITNWKNWPVNLTEATDCEVEGAIMSNCGNSAEFAGLTTPRFSVSSGSYTPSTGATMLTTTAPHGINPGQTFSFFGTTTSIPFTGLMGEQIATAGTAGTTVNFTGQIGLGTFSPFPPAGSSLSVGITTKCFNVGFVDCLVSDIRDLGVVLYGGVVGGYIRRCEVSGCSGPFIYNDTAQPGSNVDCEISNCYSHDNTGNGPSVTSNTSGALNYRSRIFNNTVSNNLGGGGISVNAADGAEIFGNLLHNNAAVAVPGGTQAGIAGAIVLGGNTNVSITGNTISDPAPASLSRSTAVINGGSYDSSTGNATLTTVGAHNIPVGGTFHIGPIRGTGAVASLKGDWVATSGTSGTTVNFVASTGFGVLTIFDGLTSYYTPFPANNSIVSGTYDSPTGNVVLTTTSAHGYVSGNAFLLSNVTGTGALSVLGGVQIATTGSSGTTLNFTASAGSTLTITGGNILPPNLGIVVFPDAYTFPNASDNVRVTNNFIADTQSPNNLSACVGGTWGSTGYSVGNVYGGRSSTIADVSVYTPGSSGSMQGPSQDTLFQLSIGNYISQGYVNFQGLGAPALNAQFLQPKGLTPGWNFSIGDGEVDFFCGRDSGAPGGFSFIQVAPITVSSGTYDSGTGAVVMTTRVPHGMLPGSLFTVSGATGTGADLAKLDTTKPADAGTTGSTLNFTIATGLTISSITGATIVPDGTAGGVIDTSRGISGSIFANDGFGNTRLGGSLVFAPQVAALANAGTVTVNPHVGFVLIQNGSSVATASVILPAPKAGQFADGAEIELNFQNAVGTLAMTAAVGSSIINAPTAVAAAGNSVSFINVGTVWTRRIPM